MFWSSPQIVEYRKVGEQWGRSSDAIVADGRTFYIAKDLKPGQTYEFRVYAFTLTSFSEPSDVVRFILTSTSDTLTLIYPPSFSLVSDLGNGDLRFVLDFACVQVIMREI